jgi:hypothetical protein
MHKLVATRSNTDGKIKKKYIHVGRGFMPAWPVTRLALSSSLLGIEAYVPLVAWVYPGNGIRNHSTTKWKNKPPVIPRNIPVVWKRG